MRAMIRGLFRLIGYIFLFLAFIALVLDGVAYLATNEIKFMPLGETWTSIAPASLNQFQFAVQEHLGLVELWDKGIIWVLLQPTAAVLAVIGLLFCLIGRRKKRREGFAV